MRGRDNCKLTGWLNNFSLKIKNYGNVGTNRAVFLSICENIQRRGNIKGKVQNREAPGALQ